MRTNTMVARLGVMLSAAILVLAQPAGAATEPAAAAPAGPTLTDLVTQTARDRAAADPGLATRAFAETKVNVLRTQGDRWAFGTVVMVAPQHEHHDVHPHDWLFVAERTDAGWQVSLDGDAGFADLTAKSPVMSAKEKQIFGSHGDRSETAANGDLRTGMRLPWALNQSWLMLGGPHAYDAGSGPWSSLDLAGGDQRVLAARAGLAYTMCTGLVRVVHDRGYSTRYYHLWDHIWANGTSVSAGTFLGYTGTETGCGGSARARHVHFSLMQNGGFVGIANHVIGKWLPRNGSAQYGGSAMHGSRVVYVGGALYNYGPLGFTQGIIDAHGDSSVNRRSGPGTGHSVVGTVADGSTIDIACSANGTTHTGRWGTTSLWNRLTNGTWVSDAYVYTGVSGPVNGWC